MDYLTTHTSLSPIRFTPDFVNYKKGCTRLAAASDKVYQLLVHGRWFSPGNPDVSTTKTVRHHIAEILLKVASNTKIQIKSKWLGVINNEGRRSLVIIAVKLNIIVYLINCVSTELMSPGSISINTYN